MTSGAMGPAGPERAMTLRNTNVPTNSVSRRARIATISGGPSGSGLLFEHLADRSLARQGHRLHHLAHAGCDLGVGRRIPDERALDLRAAPAFIPDARRHVHVRGLVGVERQLTAGLS